MIANGRLRAIFWYSAQRGAIGTPIYEALMQRYISVRSYYAETELDNLEAQRRFSILKLFVDREDRVALRWLVGLNGNNLHAAGYRKIREHCEEKGCETPWRVFERLSSGLLEIGGRAGLSRHSTH